MTSGRQFSEEQIKIIGQLHEAGRTFEEIASTLGVSARTVSRWARRLANPESYEQRLRNVWTGMRYRCRNKTTRGWRNYSGRGIRVCEAWSSFQSFREWALANGYRPGLEIDRYDNDGDYSPSNCRFVTRMANSNNKRNNVRVCAFGQTKTIAQWCRDERCTVSEGVLVIRVRRHPEIQPELAMTLSQREWIRMTRRISA